MTHEEMFRNSLVECLCRELVGPDPLPGQDHDVIQESPCQRYSAGVLFPSHQPLNELEDVSPADAPAEIEPPEVPPELLAGDDGREPREQTRGGEAEGSDACEETIRLANAFFPSAMGMTFIADFPEDGLVVEPRAAVYESRKPSDPDSRLREWHHRELRLAPVLVRVKKGSPAGYEAITLDEGLQLRVVHRARADSGLMFTISLVNTKPARGDLPPSGGDCFFQVGFRVRDLRAQAVFREYRIRAPLMTDPEEASLELLYRERRAFAVGHGCAAEWGEDRGGRTDWVATCIVPAFELPTIEPRAGSNEALSMYFLSGADGAAKDDDIIGALREFVDGYDHWIRDERARFAEIPARLREAAERHMAACESCRDRIRGGIELLVDDERAMEAFRLANLVILRQQWHYRRQPRDAGSTWEELPCSCKPTSPDIGYWRFFQLAFLLMNLRGLTPGADGSTHSERDLVDLIWFPTGSGKTEAYLAISAYTILLRRLMNPPNAGCTVLMRYTLRVLTAQQFQRASSLICACELIRQAEPERFGGAPITIGLWVGQSLSPNTRDEAIRAVNALADGRQSAENPFQILTCPWCGTRMDNRRRLGYVVGGRPKTVRLICPEVRCPFSLRSNPLPVLVIDEDIYDAPPALVIGTVDKFAMLAWREKAGALFGLPRRTNGPPDLIIQDELHLISGPLGSMVGLYEGVIDLLCSWRGRRPKIVASTATIRRAAEQCKALYDREVFQFPPPGLQVSDSWFAFESADGPRRVYVGVMASAASSFVTAQVRVASALLQGCKSLLLPVGADDSTRDPYWTLVAYFNSLRELGHAATLFQADIPEYMWAIASRAHIPKELCRRLGFPVEMTSRRSAEEIPDILNRLTVTHPKAPRSEHRPLDVLLATNMISVGVDIPRLGLMLVVGQPKTTSEYIQASSRVGRTRRAPGLIVALYNSGRPRDRSHYEHFRSYHAAIYRYVEPTSVTPFSLPVLERALHALLVIVTRHLCGLTAPDEFDPSASGVQRLLTFLQERSQRADPEHGWVVNCRLRELIDRWRDLLPGEWGRFGPPPEGRPLMYPAGTEPRQAWDDLSWPTPSSLRNVDVECEGQVLGIWPETAQE